MTTRKNFQDASEFKLRHYPQFGTHVTSVDVVKRINACCTSLATIWALSVPSAGVILLVSLMQLR